MTVDLLAGYQHGEYRTYMRETKAGLIPCDLCRRAANAYVREWRGRTGRGRNDKKKSAAYSRALWRLSRLHPAQFQALVDDEFREGGVE